MRQFSSDSNQYNRPKTFQELLSPRLFHRRQQNGGTIVQRVLQQQQFQQMFQQYQLQQQQQEEEGQHQSSSSTMFSTSCDDTSCQPHDSLQSLHISPSIDSGDAVVVAAPVVHLHHYHQQHQLQPQHNQPPQQQAVASVTRASSVRSAPLRPRYESSSLPRMSNSDGGNGRAAVGRFLQLQSADEQRDGTTTSSMPASNSDEQHQQMTNGDFFPTNMQMRVEWTEQQRRRLYRIALNFFNKKPDLGVQLLINWGFVRNSARELALLFMERRGISKQMIGEYLGTLRSQFHASVLNCFIEQISMYDMDIDIAIRQLLKYIRLPLEAQKIDHIIQAFSQHYVACNRHRLCALDTPDAMYILAFAVIMLNTDLHTPSLKDSRRMKLDEFVQNLYRLEEARHMDRNILAGIYERVKLLEFQAGTDHVTQVLKVDQSISAKEKPKLVEPHRRLICYCRLHQLIDPNKRQSSTAHQREIFLFNDMMLVCKLISVGRRKSSGLGQYQLRYSTPLIGLHVKEFQNNIYSNGLLISCADGQVLMFNAKNGDDRFRFIADIHESVAESTEMEQWRQELELDKQQQRQLIVINGYT
ncbi:hypothetical protein GPALN_015044 [Globodera pallida]|nr:hypothetical protein GPALN_015044 [Globodera pallida]